jgi:ectoine hydroxylase-related dioxygenase (phytanoyl-CoA dioxygenase family)
MRYHRTRALLLLYYPQDVTPDMGPTAIQPGSQYYKNGRPDLPGLDLHAAAGSVVITHYELWHQATANTGDRMRFMLKFSYTRTEEPNAPSWNCATTHSPTEEQNWQPAEHPRFPHRTLWHHIWHWHTGAIPTLDGPPSDDEIAAMTNPDHDARRRAADYLGLYGPAAQNAIPALTSALTDADEAVRLNAAYALGSIGTR